MKPSKQINILKNFVAQFASEAYVHWYHQTEANARRYWAWLTVTPKQAHVLYAGLQVLGYGVKLVARRAWNAKDGVEICILDSPDEVCFYIDFPYDEGYW